MSAATIACVVFLLVVAGVRADFKLLLLHNNDMHVRFEPVSAEAGKCADQQHYTGCFGGFARVHRAVTNFKRQAAARNRSSIFINAGDTFQGTAYFTHFKWPVVADIIDLMDIDVMSLGNHEFDNDIDGLAPYLKNISTPVVTCNLNLTLEPKLQVSNLKNSLVLNVSGVKIGVIGYLTPETKYLSNTGNVIFLDEITSIRQEAKRLKSQGVNIIIALGHSGYAVDQQIAKNVEELDIVVGGHSHSFLYTGNPPDIDKPVGPYPTMVTQSSGKEVPVVQAYAYTKYLGYLELDFDNNWKIVKYLGSPVLLDSNFPEDEEILKRLEPWKKEIRKFSQQPIGVTKVLLDAALCRQRECNVGNLMADAYVDYNARRYTGASGWTDAAIAITQAGGIRSSIDAFLNNGTISMEDALTVMPFNDSLVKLQVIGSVLLEALEWSVHRFENTSRGHVGEFLQFSGMRVTYNLSMPSYQRVLSARVLCRYCAVPVYEELNKTARYGVIAPDYLVKGGDGFEMFKSIPKVPFEDKDVSVLIAFLKNKSPVYPAIEGRITFSSTNPPVTPSSGHTTKHNSMLIIVSLVLFCFKSVFSS